MTSCNPTSSPRGPRRFCFPGALATWALPLAALGLLAPHASAQSMKPAGDGTTIQPPASAKPTSTADVGIDQKLNTQIPGDLTFQDDTGQFVTLQKYYDLKRPILFTLVYYGCPRLCTTVLNEMNKALMPVDLTPGKDFEIVVISFDPREGPDLSYKKKQEYTRFYRRPGTEAGWHFLTGNEANIKALTDTVGFRYAWDEKHSQFIHAGGVMVLTPEGRTSKYFYGVDYVPRDIRLALVEAGDGKIGSLSDQVLLYCFQYDPHSGKYSLAVLKIVKVAGALTLLGLGTFLVLSFRRDRRTVLSPAEAAAARAQADRAAAEAAAAEAAAEAGPAPAAQDKNAGNVDPQNVRDHG